MLWYLQYIRVLVYTAFLFYLYHHFRRPLHWNHHLCNRQMKKMIIKWFILFKDCKNSWIGKPIRKKVSCYLRPLDLYTRAFSRHQQVHRNPFVLHLVDSTTLFCRSTCIDHPHHLHINSNILHLHANSLESLNENLWMTLLIFYC